MGRLGRFTSPARRRMVLAALRAESEITHATDGWNVPDSAAFDVVVLVTPDGEFLQDPQTVQHHLRLRKDAVKRLARMQAGEERDKLQGWLDSHTLTAIEVKSIQTQHHAGKVTMSSKATARKLRWAEMYAAEVLTVAVDDRRGRHYSGNRLAWKCGVGSARLSDMTRASDHAALADAVLEGCKPKTPKGE
jgi:hypothetical protein